MFTCVIIRCYSAIPAVHVANKKYQNVLTVVDKIVAISETVPFMKHNGHDHTSLLDPLSTVQ